MFESWLQSSFDNFKNTFECGRVPSSVIISGSPDLGSASLAVEFARLYLCADNIKNVACGQCKSCLLFEDIAHGSHPDFIALLSSTTEESNREEDITHEYSKLFNDMGTPVDEDFVNTDFPKGNKSVRIDGVRRLTEWVSQGSVLGRGKVAVISNAHLMGEGAANALLKTFEEPTENTLIILLTKSFENLPATILSRAYKIQIPKVSESVAREFLKNKLGTDFDEDRISIALALAFNSPRGALRYYMEELDKKAVSFVCALIKDISEKSYSYDSVDILLSLSNEHKTLILQEIILELLKYKARIDINSLPLLKGQDLSRLVQLPATHLLDVYSDIKYIRADTPMLNNRAPVALLKTWINAFSRI